MSLIQHCIILILHHPPLWKETWTKRDNIRHFGVKNSTISLSDLEKSHEDQGCLPWDWNINWGSRSKRSNQDGTWTYNILLKECSGMADMRSPIFLSCFLSFSSLYNSISFFYSLCVWVAIFSISCVPEHVWGTESSVTVRLQSVIVQMQCSHVTEPHAVLIPFTYIAIVASWAVQQP